jgi:hypothetical protein
MIDSLSVYASELYRLQGECAWADCFQGARRGHSILGLVRKARWRGNHRAGLTIHSMLNVIFWHSD